MKSDMRVTLARVMTRQCMLYR